MLNVVIFSVDRACQLDALLRSVESKMGIDYSISVLFKYSNKEFMEGYDVVINKFSSMSFIKESNYRVDTLRLSLDPKYTYFLWLVDDCIMKNCLSHDSFFERFINDDAVGMYNLRMTPTMQLMSDFSDDIVRPLPIFNSDNTWEWRKAEDTYWNYPMTMDAHMYKTRDMTPYLHSLAFGPPPSMDSVMWQNPLNRPLMICNSQQKVIGIAPNRVQTGSPNRHGNVTTKELNDIWLSGKQIKLDGWYKLDENIMRYHLMDFEFEER